MINNHLNVLVALLPRTRMATKLLVCLLVLLPGIFAGTKFEKCKRLGTDLCFKMKVKEIVVKIGNVGTNDDVTINLCSDYETDKVFTIDIIEITNHDPNDLFDHSSVAQHLS